MAYSINHSQLNISSAVNTALRFLFEINRSVASVNNIYTRSVTLLFDLSFKVERCSNSLMHLNRGSEIL